MTSINSLIDISFIQTNSRISNGINMNSRSIYNIREIGINDKSGTGDIPVIKYGNTNIMDDSNNYIIVNDIYKLNTYLLDVSNINYSTFDCSGTFATIELDASNINTIIMDCSGIFKTKDISLNTLNTVYIDCSNINSKELYSDNIILNNIGDISNNINIFNSHISLDASNNSVFNFIKYNNNNLISYDSLNNIIFDPSNVTIYGVLRVSGTYTAGTINAATTDVQNYFGSTSVEQVSATSDDRLKHNEQPLSNAILTINKLKPKIYIKTQNLYDADMSFNSHNIPVNSIKSSGYIAQDISNNIPELKHLINTVNIIDDDILSVNYTGIQPYITKSIQELDSLLNINDISLVDLENRIKTLESN